MFEARRWALDALSHCQLMNIYYEDLCQQQDVTIAAVCSALGVCTFKPNAVRAKVERLPMSQRLTNYFDLKRSFKGTAYEVYFDE
jgi:hypothetical protein